MPSGALCYFGGLLRPARLETIVERAVVKDHVAREKAEAAKRDVIRTAEAKAAKGDKGMQCMLHLWDLKRFGYSPTRTELNIPRERPGTMLRPTNPYRIYSSSPTGW